MTINTYDEIPYPSLVYTDTHPGRLATLATLFGIKPPPVATSLSTYPTASPLARRLAPQGQQPVINLRCEFINLSAIATVLLPHLNGENDSQALRSILKKLIKKPEFQQLKKRNLSTVLEKAMLEIAQGALLVA
ncbi:MAG: hypothetical protein DRR19_31005 [Candidatus Parabeggiatoa sp. nov. 1]|nr:MAG: hypothetical protein DRR19_31005 [Gammaproteobacteria bacterium]